MDVGKRSKIVAQKGDFKEIIRKAKTGDLSAFQDALITYEAKHGIHLPDTKEGHSILHMTATLAASTGHGEIVLYLCREFGVPINAAPDDYEGEVAAGTEGQTPLTVAIRRGNEDLALQLLAIPQPPGKEATRRPYKGVAIENYTVLHFAASYNAVRVVEALLVEHGIDLNAKDSDKSTPLDIGV
jgi:ankyrin repeat protein